MSRTIRTFIDSDRLSAELDPRCWLDAPITRAHRRGRHERRGDARRRPPQCGARSAMRAYPTAAAPPQDAVAQGKPRKVAQRKAERDAAWSKLIAALVAAGVERR